MVCVIQIICDLKLKTIIIINYWLTPPINFWMIPLIHYGCSLVSQTHPTASEGKGLGKCLH